MAAARQGRTVWLARLRRVAAASRGGTAWVVTPSLAWGERTAGGGDHGLDASAVEAAQTSLVEPGHAWPVGLHGGADALEGADDSLPGVGDAGWVGRDEAQGRAAGEGLAQAEAGADAVGLGGGRGFADQGLAADLGREGQGPAARASRPPAATASSKRGRRTQTIIDRTYVRMRVGRLAPLCPWLSQSRRSFVCPCVSALVEPEPTIRPARRLRLRRGLSADEVAELFDELGAPLLSWFRREVKTRDEAADLWSETWARVVASRSRIRGSTRGEHAAFVYTTARNLLADWRRRGVVEQRALSQLGIAPLRIEDDLPEIGDPAVLTHLDQLPEEQREAVRLRVIEELDYDEIAARTGATESAVRQRVSRGLKWLRGRMDEEEQG